MQDFEQQNSTELVNSIILRMATKGLDANTITPFLRCEDNIRASHADWKHWETLFNDPLTVSPTILNYLLKLKDSNFGSAAKHHSKAIFYVRTFQLTVNQLRQLIPVLVVAKITFLGRVFEWEKRISTLSDHDPVYLRYAGVSKSYNAWQRHRRDLRTTRKVSSVMRTIHVMMHTFPDVVSNCLVQELPQLEIPADDPSVNIREQLLISILEQGLMNVSIGGSASSALDDTDKALFENLGTTFGTAAAQNASNPSELLTQKVREYALQIVERISTISPEQVTGGGGSWYWQRIISTQAIPFCLKNGHAIQIFLGHAPSKKANNNSPGFWASESETSKIMLTILGKCLQWEIAPTDTQEHSLAEMIDRGFLPFLNLYPWGNAGKEDFEHATNLLRMYLKAARPLLIVCLGTEVAAAACRGFRAGGPPGLPGGSFFSSIGETKIIKHTSKEESDDDKDHYSVQITSYHPGALSVGSVSQRPMQRVLTLTMFKVWVFMCETLKYSAECLDEYELCEMILRDVETRLKATNFYTDLQSAKDEIVQTNGKLRWRDQAGRVTSKSLRLSSTLRINGPATIRRDPKSNGRRGKALARDHKEALSPLEMAARERSDHTLNMPTASTSGITDQQTSFQPRNVSSDLLPASYYEGRRLLFQMSYCNESVAQHAVDKLLQKLPLQLGDLLWLLDMFLLQEFPEGGTLNCADPTIFPNKSSIWPTLSQFCELSRYCMHPYAEYLWTKAKRASQGTYATQQAVISLGIALKMLRTSVQKRSFQPAHPISDHRRPKESEDQEAESVLAVMRDLYERTFGYLVRPVKYYQEQDLKAGLFGGQSGICILYSGSAQASTPSAQVKAALQLGGCNER